MTVKEELELIADQNGGTITPEKVVAFAKRKKTALHAKFTWDDSKAAQQYRLEEARRVIRVHVTVINGADKPVRAYVSLKQDRGEIGYRRTVDVIAEPDLRAMMLEEAKAEMQVFADKYRSLSELSPVIDAIDTVIGAEASDNGKPRRPKGQTKRQTTRRMATAVA